MRSGVEGSGRRCEDVKSLAYRWSSVVVDSTSIADCRCSAASAAQNKAAIAASLSLARRHTPGTLKQLRPLPHRCAELQAVLPLDSDVTLRAKRPGRYLLESIWRPSKQGTCQPQCRNQQ